MTVQLRLLVASWCRFMYAVKRHKACILASRPEGSQRAEGQGSLGPWQALGLEQVQLLGPWRKGQGLKRKLHRY